MFYFLCGAKPFYPLFHQCWLECSLSSQLLGERSYCVKDFPSIFFYVSVYEVSHICIILTTSDTRLDHMRLRSWDLAILPNRTIMPLPNLQTRCFFNSWCLTRMLILTKECLYPKVASIILTCEKYFYLKTPIGRDLICCNICDRISCIAWQDWNF